MWEEFRIKFLDGLIVLFFALFGGATRFVLAPPRERTLLSILGSLVIAGFSGVLIWAVLDSHNCDPMIVAAGTGIGGLLGDDILKGLMALGKIFREDPSSILNKWLGRKGEDDR